MTGLVKEFVAFIVEREKVRKNKEAKKPRPWTKDPILDKYRFCNVHREDDRMTKEIHDWALQYYGEPDLWFAYVVARLLNLRESLDDVSKFVLPFEPQKFIGALAKRKAKGLKNFNAAYIVSTNGIAMDKVMYVVQRVLQPLWKDRKRLRPSVNDTLAGWHLLLSSYNGLGSFIAAQVVADMKYKEPLKDAPDWWSFAASGPGSRRGLNRVMGYAPGATWNEEKWRARVATVIDPIRMMLQRKGIAELHAQDFQNCLCEFDKYRRAVEGQGTPKQIYKEKNNAG